MKKNFIKALVCLGGMVLPATTSMAQIRLLQDFKNYNSPAIGTFQGINFREAGFSGMYPVPNTNGKEFWVVSDRGVNIDAANANPSGCRPTYDKIYAFPNYAPKIHRIRVNGDSVQILQTITMKRPGGANATGIINPTGFGSKITEQASTDTVQDCANFSSKIAAKDVWGIDAEGIAVDRDGNFWLCEEGGPTVWKLNQNGVVLKRYSPYAGLPGAEAIDVAIDTVFKYRKNNRGFEGITIAPNGKIYAIIQSPVLFPTTSIGESTRIHRLLEINPATDATRMFAYLNDGVIGSSGPNQIRLKDWKFGDMAAINDTTFLVLEAALRGTTDIKKIYKINIGGATPVTSGLYSGVTLEALVDSAGLAANSIVPVRKSLFMDLLANGWDATLEKAEGMAILNDSTLFICNDNDYGQVSPAENGVATATTTLSHVVKYGLSGANKLVGFVPTTTTLSMGLTGPSTSRTPYLVPAQPGARFTSILTATETVGSYKMCGTPDGLGAFDNNDGTFTVVMNHEFGNTAGATRAHGSVGAFVSKWVVNKSDLSVVSGSDLIRNINIWNPLTSSYITYNSSFPGTAAAINRFCSADMPEVSAFYNAATGKGTTNRIFMNGEEAGTEGRAFAHIVTGSAAGTSYELPALGKFSWENALANPIASDTTVVIGTDDATPGQLYVYVGAKSATGNDVEKAGLTNGKVFGVAVTGLTTETSGSIPAPGTAFTLADLGRVTNMTGAELNTASNAAGVTNFLRPEDGAWDPKNPNDFYFATTNAFASPSRLWRLRFTNAANPALGGTITALLDGTEGQKMLDNITIDNYGHVLMVEDVGNNAHVGKVWQYTIATDSLVQVGGHDTTRFVTGGANFLTQDEEASGIIDVENILGPGNFLIVDQAHYSISGEAVEGGQFLSFFNPATYNAAPDVNVKGNGISITDGDNTPSTADSTNYGTVYVGNGQTKTYVIENTGVGALTVTGINFTGANAAEFTLVAPPTFPFSLSTGANQTITVRFAPLNGGTRNATINIASNDANEGNYDYALTGASIDSAEINVQGNAINIVDGDLTPGIANNTDFGTLNLGTNVTKMFIIQNTAQGHLTLSGINFTGANAGDFTIVGGPTFPMTINGLGSYALTVQFAPSAVGDRNATLNIRSNDIDEATFDFSVKGAGAGAPEITLKGNGNVIYDGDITPGAANNTDYGAVNTGATRNKNYMIYNDGTGVLTISGISFTGANASEFTLYGAPAFPISIPAAGYQSIDVQFLPTGAGYRTATLSVVNNDADESIYDFTLQGNGVSAAGVTTLSGNTAFNVYPNPAGNSASIAMSLNNEAQISISVIDMQGKEVLPATEQTLKAGKHTVELNTATLANGVYFLKITDGESATHTKLSIMH